VLAVHQVYLQQWLLIRWRTWMTRSYLDQWLAAANHYRMQLLGDAADNPDQRNADDIRLFIERGISIGLRLLSAVVTLLSFVVLLWTLSADAPFRVFGYEVAIPGYLVWAALVYAIAGTMLTHLIGSPLIRLNFNQQRYEADFRFNLVRVRENSEQIALLDGEKAEQQRLLDRFANVINNWWAIMTRTKRLTFLTAGYGQFAIIIPFIVALPAYFEKRFMIGGLMQISSAFDNVRGALSVFIDVYRDFAEWRAVVDRLEGFNRSVAAAKAAATPAIAIAARDGDDVIEIDDLLVRLPQGAPLVAADGIRLRLGDRVLVTGPSGAGKSTLLRAVAGIWPFGSGEVKVPRGAKIMALPQRPYLPIGTLAAAVTYPSVPGTFPSERIAEALVDVGLPEFASRLDEEAHWNRMLSLGEQQRLGIARAVLQAPDYLLLDEATASLDEPAEAALYRLIAARLPHTTTISVGHRSTLKAFHRRHLRLVREGTLHRLTESALETAAE